MSNNYGQKYYNYYPTGALRTREEVLDLVIEARKEKKAIRIYTVNQGGRLDCFYIYSKTKLHKKGAPDPTPSPLKEGVLFDMLYPIVHDHRSISSSKTNKRWFKWHEHIGSYGIKDGSPYPTEHRMFTNKKAAEEYSTFLQNDREYQEGIVRWHKYCNKCSTLSTSSGRTKMSRYSYEGDFINPAGSCIVVPNPNEEKGGYIIGVKVSTDDILQELIDGAITSEEAYNLRLKGWRPHTNNTVFEDEDLAIEWIEGLEEFFEQDYDDYLEENHHSIVQMERYEMWRNEY